MSIYATLWTMKIEHPEHWDEWLEVTAQGVPNHISMECEWLPPPIPEDPTSGTMRAVVLVHEHDTKGTDRSGQEYRNPLLVLSGAEYDAIGWKALLERIWDAMERRREVPKVLTERSMNPTEIRITKVAVPLGGTFGHVEAEVAAAYMVLAMQRAGKFCAVTTDAIAEAMDQRKEDPDYRWMHNPFLRRPSLEELVEKGYAAWEGEAFESPIAFTDSGLEVLANSRWRAEVPKP